MRINFDNTYFPKPIINSNLDDYKKNIFNIIYKNNKYDKINQLYEFDLELEINNKEILSHIENGDIVPILHLEQKTQRETIRLFINNVNHIKVDLMQYATNDNIEVIAILFCKNEFRINSESLNDVYSLLNNSIDYSRGEIIGYSNQFSIPTLEDKKIGSIFSLTADKNKILKNDSFKISLNNDYINIIMDEKIYVNFIDIYKKSPQIKRIFFSCAIMPALISAYTEMFNNYESYKDYKWCKTLSYYAEKEEKSISEDIFVTSNYELDKVYHYMNLAMNNLFKDAVDFYYNFLNGKEDY